MPAAQRALAERGLRPEQVAGTGPGGRVLKEDVARHAEERQEAFSDGVGVLAAVHNLDGGLLVHERRMVFVKDSPEEKGLRSLKPGEGMHVLGVPRISLKLLSYRAAHHSENQHMLDWTLPYEIVIVGYYGKVPASQLQ